MNTDNATRPPWAVENNNDQPRSDNPPPSRSDVEIAMAARIRDLEAQVANLCVEPQSIVELESIMESGDHSASIDAALKFTGLSDAYESLRAISLAYGLACEAIKTQQAHLAARDRTIAEQGEALEGYRSLIDDKHCDGWLHEITLSDLRTYYLPAHEIAALRERGVEVGE